MFFRVGIGIIAVEMILPSASIGAEMSFHLTQFVPLVRATPPEDPQTVIPMVAISAATDYGKPVNELEIRSTNFYWLPVNASGLLRGGSSLVDSLVLAREPPVPDENGGVPAFLPPIMPNSHLMVFEFDNSQHGFMYVPSTGQPSWATTTDSTAAPFIPPRDRSAIVQGFGPFYQDMVIYERRNENKRARSVEVFGHDGWVPVVGKVQKACDTLLCRASWKHRRRLYYFTYIPTA